MRAECAAHALAAREPYGVWGGFTESERLRLLAAGWEDAVKARGWVDVSRLEARLGQIPPVPPPRSPVNARRGQPKALVRGVSAPGR